MNSTPVDGETHRPEAERVDSAIDSFLADLDGGNLSDRKIWEKQFDAGLAWVDFPIGLGGLGVSRAFRARVARRLAEAGIPDSGERNGIGVVLAAPVLVSHGSREQQERYLRPLFIGEELWCQLFSEPGAGSDLASLATRAVAVGEDEYAITGQKVWTTMGHTARWGLLCARTDPDVPKHAGLSMFVLDMHAPGVEVRPIRQLTGEAHFNEVFFEDAPVPVANRIGEEGQGWAAIIATLANERATFAAEPLPQGGGAIAQVIQLWNEHHTDNLELADEYAKLWVRAEVVRLAELAAMSIDESGVPGPAWSYLKVMRSELEQQIYSFGVTLMGADGLQYPSYEYRQAARMDDGHGAGADVRTNFLFARSATIAGGTSEVQRTIIADRVLQLPREPNLEKNTPWRELRRS